jgi:hypothetical protein
MAAKVKVIFSGEETSESKKGKGRDRIVKKDCEK